MADKKKADDAKASKPAAEEAAAATPAADAVVDVTGFTAIAPGTPPMTSEYSSPLSTNEALAADDDEDDEG